MGDGGGDGSAGSVEESLRLVRERIAAACRRSGRTPEAVELVAVSKLQPVGLVRAAFAAGQRDFGENLAQDLRDRATALADLAGLRWHMQGALQRNKAKYVARHASAFHALDGVDIAVELGRRREGDPLPCYVEVNVAAEPTKHGVEPGEVARLVEAVRAVAGVDLVGLMSMPPHAERAEDSRRWFALMRDLAERVGLPKLSMGTTGDFEVAVEEGATSVRVGRALFGARPARV